MKLEGIYPIVPTPFLEDGSLDFPSIERLVAFMAQKKVNGLAVMGVLGEGHKLTQSERVDLIAKYRELLPRNMGLVVGVRAPATDPAVMMAVKAQELGADAILLGPHGVQKDAALLGYYQRVSDALEVPVIIHDYPAATGISMSVELITRMYESASGIDYIKLEDPPTGAKMRALAKTTGTGLKVFGALGGLYAFEEMESGAVGIMTGFVYAELLVQMYNWCKAGRWEAAAALFYDFLPLNRWEFQPGIGVSLRKKVLKQLGIFSTAKVRHPGPDADDQSVAQLFRIVRHLQQKGYPLADKPAGK